MDQIERLDILQNDVTLIQKLRIMKTPDGHLEAAAPPGLLGDDQKDWETVAIYQNASSLNSKVIAGICTTVRGAYNARQERKEAEAFERREALEASRESGDRPPEVAARASVPAEAFVQDRQTTVEELLQAQIIIAGRLLKERKRERDAQNELCTRLDTEITRLELERERCIVALKVIRQSKENSHESSIEVQGSDNQGDPAAGSRNPRRRGRKAGVAGSGAGEGGGAG